jgi:hypothetical protein
VSEFVNFKVSFGESRRMTFPTVLCVRDFDFFRYINDLCTFDYFHIIGSDFVSQILDIGFWI